MRGGEGAAEDSGGATKSATNAESKRFLRVLFLRARVKSRPLHLSITSASVASDE